MRVSLSFESSRVALRSNEDFALECANSREFARIAGMRARIRAHLHARPRARLREVPREVTRAHASHRRPRDLARSRIAPSRRENHENHRPDRARIENESNPNHAHPLPVPASPRARPWPLAELLRTVKAFVPVSLSPVRSSRSPVARRRARSPRRSCVPSPSSRPGWSTRP